MANKIDYSKFDDEMYSKYNKKVVTTLKGLGLSEIDINNLSSDIAEYSRQHENDGFVERSIYLITLFGIAYNSGKKQRNG